ncbi:MAG: 2-oxo acid dehydrogenase subunit E2 [Actinobacteria bacterium]|nr:2-oxo acid dehydrogenase subunit E2 [Actinomycetota bacterium]
MSNIAYFDLPDVGEGLTEAEIVSWKVKVGDVVAVNQIIVEIETAKSLVELPCPFAGTVTELLANEGDTVNVGSHIIAVAVSEITSAVATSMHEAVTAAITTVQAADEKKEPNLVGYGVSGSATSRRRRATTTTAPVVVNEGPATNLIAVVPGNGVVLAKPPVRKLAKDLGVDLTAVVATGPSGEVTREDVLAATGKATPTTTQTVPATPVYAGERDEIIPVKGVRKAIASAMVKSARTMEYVKRLKTSPDFAGVKVTPLLIMAKAIMWAVKRNPNVNSTWTDTEIIIHHYVNLGIAAATPRGLIVPNIKDADQLSMVDLARALENLATVAREGRTTPQDMQNGTITITNIGIFGVDTGTPILNPGEVGIVALGSIRPKPWVVDNEIVIRQVTTVGATFDHRVVDGDVASRFVQDVASVLEEPALLLG